MGISLALYRVIARDLGKRISTRVIQAGRACQKLAPESVALEGFTWVEKNRLDKAKSAGIPAKDRKVLSISDVYPKQNHLCKHLR